LSYVYIWLFQYCNQNRGKYQISVKEATVIDWPNN